MEVRWLFQEVQYPTVDSSKRKDNHLTNTRSFPRTQGLGILDYKDPLKYAQYSRWERPIPRNIIIFQNKGDKKKISRASREKICHPQRSRIPTCSKQWPCRDNGATNPKSWRKDLHQTTDLLGGQKFSDRKELLSPLFRRNRVCISLKHRSESREP